jgi:hypothetical protein
VEALSGSTACYVVGCVSTATGICASCGRACCESHRRWVSVDRRAERLESNGHQRMLERVPTHAVTYTVCLGCSKKPITIKP